MTRPFRFGAQVSRGRSAEKWAEKARRLEGMGYAVMSMADHFDDQLAPVPGLMAAAAATTTLRIGSLVFDNDYRHPVVLAKEAATLDLLSDGRLEFGIGAGWQLSDYEQAGMPYDPPKVRIDRMEEGLAVIKGLFTGEPFSFSGAHYTIRDLVGTPVPVQKPGPPVLIGGGAKRVLGIAGREADIISINFDLRTGAVTPELGPTVTAEMTHRKVEWIKAGAGNRFDDIELSVTAFFASITDDRQSLADAVGPSFGLTPKQALDVPHFLVGTESQIIEDLHRRREEFGISYVVISGGAEEAMAPIVAKLAGAT